MDCGGLPPLLKAKLASRYTEASFGAQSAGKPAHSKIYSFGQQRLGNRAADPHRTARYQCSFAIHVHIFNACDEGRETPPCSSPTQLNFLPEFPVPLDCLVRLIFAI
jgi:hypothetical protein